jgi:hypothetical protein
VAAGVALVTALLAMRMPRHAAAADADSVDIDARVSRQVVDLPAAA